MPDEQVIELKVQLELRDFLRATYWMLFRYAGTRLLAGFAFIWLMWAIMYVCASAPGIAWQPLAFLLSLPGIFLLLMAGIFFAVKRRLETDRSAQRPITYRFSNSGFEIVAVSSSARGDWENIYEAHESRHNFYLFISRSLAYTIPKRCFHDEQYMLAFKSLLRDQLGECAVLKRD